MTNTPLTALPDVVAGEAALTAILGRRSGILAVPEAARAVVLAALARRSPRRPLVVAVPTTAMAESLTADIAAYLGPEEVMTFPAWETLPFERVSPAVDTMGRRLEVIWRLGEPGRHPAVIVAPVRALVQILGPAGHTTEPLEIAPHGSVEPDSLAHWLVESGYRREFQVEHRGEFAIRGGIVDVFPSTAEVPVRIDLWGDEVERLTEFSVADQRSTVDLEGVRIFPALEVVPTPEVRRRAGQLVSEEPWGREQWERLAGGETFDGMESWLPWLVDRPEILFDRLPPEAHIVLVEPRRMRDRALDLRAEEADLARTLAGTWGALEADGSEREFPRLHVEFERLQSGTSAASWVMTGTADSPEQPLVEARGWEPVAGDPSRLLNQLRGLISEGYRVVVAAEGEGSAARLVETLGAEGVGLELAAVDGSDLIEPGGRVAVAGVEHSFVLPGSRLALLTERDLTGRRRTHRRPRARRGQQGSFEDLKPGGYVVHHQHGVARYAEMVTRSIMGQERDYLILEFKGGDRIYLPSDQIDLIRPYTGGESPTLNKMGGAEFQKTRSKVRREVDRIAQELVVLYQTRVNSEGHAFAPDTPWQRELSDSFPFQETPDQLEAIGAITSDMESTAPMDRLVCGDVGFGKTEVAIRAVFKCVQEGKQAAVLVPTTLLAQQHHQTFADRFAPFPVRVESISRFLTPAQQKEVVTGLATGSVDVVIGTHRLLSSDVSFHDLGLLVVDEEQRFGVTHKEKIKQFKNNVDVLTLTATPIPRTLEMSLTGIRDLSLLQTPPAERQPILTHVGEYDERAVAEAIRRELLREGQVFFVHNRVADIDRVAADLGDLVPEARIAVAHGQMDEGTLERVVVDFWEGRYDVLVCTTIIESGIDMPSVNTLVVDRADMLGLGQLHQIRGRVGRSGQRAYAYLFHPPDRVLSEDAYERLKTIGESTELGSGFRIAMRDLEIRGAGNLLGENQTGHISAVGYDLYCQMVGEAVAELKGEPLRQPAEIKMDVPVPAFLPEDYVSRQEQRLEAYRRLAAVEDDAAVDDIAEEWLDRYGPPPEPARNLLALGRLRARCHRTGIREIAVLRGDTLRLSPVELKVSEQMRFSRLVPGGLYKDEASELHVPVRRVTGDAEMVDGLVELLDELIPADR